MRAANAVVLVILALAAWYGVAICALMCIVSLVLGPVCIPVIALTAAVGEIAVELTGCAVDAVAAALDGRAVADA